MLETKTPPDLLPLMLKKVDRLAAEAQLGQLGNDGSLSLERMRQASPHHAAFLNFVKFVNASGMTHINITSAIIESSTPLVVGEASIAFQLACVAHEVATIAATIHSDLIVPQAAGQIAIADHIFGRCTDLMHMFGNALSDLEELVSSQGALTLGGAGLPMMPPVAMAREWQRVIRTFNMRCIRSLLTRFCDVLAASTAACREVAPAWEALFPDGKYNAAMGSRMMRGRHTVDKQNMLHEVIRRLNQSPKLLVISPRVQDNELTSEAVAVALNALGNLSMCSIIATGVEILNIAAEPGGPRKAADSKRQPGLKRLRKGA